MVTYDYVVLTHWNKVTSVSVLSRLTYCQKASCL